MDPLDRCLPEGVPRSNSGHQERAEASEEPEAVEGVEPEANLGQGLGTASHFAVMLRRNMGRATRRPGSCRSLDRLNGMTLRLLDDSISLLSGQVKKLLKKKCWVVTGFSMVDELMQLDTTKTVRGICGL